MITYNDMEGVLKKAGKYICKKCGSVVNFLEIFNGCCIECIADEIEVLPGQVTQSTHTVTCEVCKQPVKTYDLVNDSICIRRCKKCMEE